MAQQPDPGQQAQAPRRGPPGAFRGLWLRVYALVFVLYQVTALAGAIWWLVGAIRTGGGGVPGLLGAYALLVVPAGFGAALLLSVPLAGLWMALARASGWQGPAPIVSESSIRRCAACRYELTGIRSERCPECGAPLAPAPTDPAAG